MNTFVKTLSGASLLALVAVPAFGATFSTSTSAMMGNSATGNYEADFEVQNTAATAGQYNMGYDAAGTGDVRLNSNVNANASTWNTSRYGASGTGNYEADFELQNPAASAGVQTGARYGQPMVQQNAATMGTQASMNSGIETYRYVYYPNERVYFDPDRDTYFYQKNDGWYASSELPANVNLGSSVSLNAQVNNPALIDSEVRMQYR